MKKIVTFGEIMGRLTTENLLRFRQCCPGKLHITFAGAEANVAASINILGGESRFVTALPRHDIADACIANLKSLGVDTNYIIRTDKGRLGLFFLETGANQRPSNVLYDRENSSISILEEDAYPWDEIFCDASWFHISGITPALSEKAAKATLKAVEMAKKNNVIVSCDLNFRKKLWQWDGNYKPRVLAEKKMREILLFVDVVIGNEEDAYDVLGIKAGQSNIGAGKLDIDRYPEVAASIVEQFPNISKVAITLRESVSATHNNWGAMLYDKKTHKPHFAPLDNGQYKPYEICDIVDRVGGGDSFAAGLLFAMTTEELSDSPIAISFAVATSCLAHSIQGDFNYNSREEVERLMKGSGTGRVIR